MTDDLRITDLRRREELEALGALLDRIWGSPAPLVPFAVLRALAQCGGMVLGARDGNGRLVGGALGFRSPDRPALHSHIVGVDPARQGTGIGRAIKQHQRRWCLDRGITAMTWTFDPLVHRNAVFNIDRLGAAGVGYLPDYYGEMPDSRNSGLPSDRVLVHWELSGPAPDPGPPPAEEPVLGPGADGEPVADRRSGGAPRSPRAGTDADAGTRAATSTGASAGGDASESPRVVLRLPIAVPPAHALAWRHALRERMAPLLDAGYRWTGVTADGRCTLVPPSEPLRTEPAPTPEESPLA
ncbi:GNAT family N-acetyltransferase [Phaeacidiphilus oryzae]|uniref:GNAT family N-acetyltransferase n=1 Tax=Phaeacidiphilus oryzae TaxID=348818 RepID=UPI00068F6BE5|nr:GNAT family N-acetyltransferase [Phaeacidiphilus oryzae]